MTNSSVYSLAAGPLCPCTQWCGQVRGTSLNLADPSTERVSWGRFGFFLRCSACSAEHHLIRYMCLEGDNFPPQA